MKQKLKRTNSNKPICSKNNNKYVGAERIGTRPIPTMPAHNKGITLVALIITIIVLLILAVVTISAVTGNGIIAHAKNARDLYGAKSEEENALLQNYLEQLNKETKGNGGSSDGNKKIDGITVKGSLNAIISTTANTPLTDDFGNKITVPAGFKIITKTDTENTDLNYTADDINVTKGIVVEDGEGNQFVWIPVGEIKNAEKTKTINLERNTFGDSEITLAILRFDNIQLSRLESNHRITSRAPEQPESIEYTEGKKNEITTNAHAKDIESFVSKTNTSGGYYIGRYEARVENYDASQISTIDNDAESNKSTDWTGYVAESGKNLKLVSKANSQVWNYVTQKKASSLCQSMYTNKPYESDLVNSYAWDTAIIFFQEFGDNSTYARKTTVNSSLANTGTSGMSTKDVICNVYDMASNCFEWSTETFSNSGAPCTCRGGGLDNGGSGYASFRSQYGTTTNAYNGDSFRPLLYM